MIILIIVLLVLIIIGLIVYNTIVYKKVQSFKNLNEKLSGYQILKDFMDTMGETMPVDEKIKKINDIIIEGYKIKYSTIVIFNGTTYEVKASNVQEKHWGVLSNLHNEEIFKDSITTATPKYVTVNNETERLPYQKIEFGRAKSALFFPLYIDNVYIGYWIIESGQMHAFDNIDTTNLELIRDNIVSIYKTVSYQKIVESTVRKDLFSDLNSAEYLYGEGRKVIDKYTISTVCMFRISNLEEINQKFNRETGNEVIIEVSDTIKDSISEEYIFVRYMGPKFVIVFSGIDNDGVVEFVKDLKKTIEDMEIEPVIDETKKGKGTKKKPEMIKVKLNFAISTYYKGTALEMVTKKLEEYLDESPEGENEIHTI